MTLASKWAVSRAAADYLQVHERTLFRWRATGLLKPGIHFRRKFPASNSPILYQLELCEKAMTDAFRRDCRTLELVGIDK